MYEIDFQKKLCNGVKLRPALLLIIKFLQENQGQIFGTKELALKFNIKKSSLKSMINEIRRQFSRSDNPIPIETVNRKGYFWNQNANLNQGESNEK